MAEFKSDKLFNKFIRPSWAGKVTISDNSVEFGALKISNPRSVKGIVVPVTTKGRQSAPTPLSGDLTGKKFNTDKGHLMALELGGPDIHENIVPQPSLWQQSGGWRALETVVLSHALCWMGLKDPYDPSQDMPAPVEAAYFAVVPSSDSHSNGEPVRYSGGITKIVIRPNSNGDWSVSRPLDAYHFFIDSQGLSWPRGTVHGHSWYRQGM